MGSMAWMSRWMLLVGCVAAAAGEHAPSTAAISSVSPGTFATDGLDTATVTGSGFAGAVAVPICRVSTPPSDPRSTTFRYGGGGYPEATGQNLSFPATVLNATALRCSPPAVIVGGAGLLDVSLDDGISFSNALPVRYAPLVLVALGRRPYLSELEANLLLAPSPRLLGLRLTVTATLPCAAKGWSWTVEVLNSSIVLPFPLSGLPPSINNDLQISVAGIPWRGSQVVAWRRLIRHVPTGTAAATAAGAGVVPEASQVDHHIRALRVGGQPFVGQGWYVYGGFAWTVRHPGLKLNIPP